MRSNSPNEQVDDDNFILENKLEIVSDSSDRIGIRQVFSNLCYFCMHLVNICAKILYLKFTPKISQQVFQGMLFTASSPYLAIMTATMLCCKPSYHKSKFILLANSVQFTLELSNNILIG